MKLTIFDNVFCLIKSFETTLFMRKLLESPNKIVGDKTDY